MEKYIDKCYELGSTTPVATMSKNRTHAASVSIQNTMWVTGGEDENFIDLRSTEFVDPTSRTVRPGPKLPKETYAHCLVKINSSTVMLIGGHSDSMGLTNKIWFFNFDNEERGWVGGPDMNTRRRAHACGIIKDSKKNPQKSLISDRNH